MIFISPQWEQSNKNAELLLLPAIKVIPDKSVCKKGGGGKETLFIKVFPPQNCFIKNYLLKRSLCIFQKFMVVRRRAIFCSLYAG